MHCLPLQKPAQLIRAAAGNGAAPLAKVEDAERSYLSRRAQHVQDHFQVRAGARQPWCWLHMLAGACKLAAACSL